jgi:NADH-quinone oxidoreductase subunit F
MEAEYLAIRTLSKAIGQAKECALLGKNILGSGFDFEINLFQGSGAFVCGEETALIASIEGFRGMPRVRPPYPVQAGLWGLPTLINNVKTFASIPPILDHGSAWYRAVGTEGSSGTAIFSVVGDVVHAGLVEVPLGTDLKTLIFDICVVFQTKRISSSSIVARQEGASFRLPGHPIDFDS